MVDGRIVSDPDDEQVSLGEVMTQTYAQLLWANYEHELRLVLRDHPEELIQAVLEVNNVLYRGILANPGPPTQ